MKCTHKNRRCINPYELIRKYECLSCSQVMMCKCEEEFALKHLPHQLSSGIELDTTKEFKVTLGFQHSVCNTCRGMPEESFPIAELYGKKSKIQRYYWREIQFETIKRCYLLSVELGYKDYNVIPLQSKNRFKTIKTEVLSEIKLLHKMSPKYRYSEESQSSIITKYNIEVINFYAPQINSNGKLFIQEKEHIYSPEEFVSKHYEGLGYKTLFCESSPFHVLFGTYFWLLIQDPFDQLNRIAGFGERSVYEMDGSKVPIWGLLPPDFGSKGYYKRRQKEFKDHMMMIPSRREELLDLFLLWESGSYFLRQYLWAHRESDIGRAREIIRVLPPQVIIDILIYLVKDYWGRYLGWPDLLVYNKKEYFFVEVKSSKDKLSLDQKNWIKGNNENLRLPFKIFKIHKKVLKTAFINI